MTRHITKFGRCRNAIVAATALFMAAPAMAVLHIEGLHEQPLADFDSRAQSLPDAAQVAAAASLNAQVSWNRFGTPQTIIRHGEFLATGLDADATVAARDYLRSISAVFSLSAADIDALELYHVGNFAFSNAKAVKFRQDFSGLKAAAGGLVTVGVIDGKVSIVTSSIVPIAAGSNVPAASLSAGDAILAAAADAGFGTGLALVNQATDNAWTTFNIVGLVGTQRATPMAFPTVDGVRNAYETVVLDNQNGRLRGYMSIVDASTGEVLYRENKVTQLADVEHSPATANVSGDSKGGAFARVPVTHAYSGEFEGPPDPFACGPLHGPYLPPAPTYLRIVMVANPTVASNDIVANIYFDDPADIPDQGPQLVSTTDVGFGEVATYEPGGNLPVGDYYAEVCPLTSSINQNWLPPYTYEGTFTFEDTNTPALANDPRWQHFRANPLPDLSSTDTRELGCWNDPTNDPLCDFTVGNTAARGPWDFDFNAGAPTNTTSGNGAIAGEAWLSPLTPAEQYRPTAEDRNYSYPWTNIWNTSGCSPTALTGPERNDIDAAVTNMFVAHNRMHDWSYYLGFTELNSNAQVDNFGNTTADREQDPEVGNVQAGASNGAFPAYLGRDNANQITLQDGVAPITNQYLWQTLLGAIYVPCADGNYDMGIVGHEYGHMIQNRMTGGPAQGLSGEQGRRMGESWGDLTGMEIQNEFGIVPVQGESPFAIGAYVLGAPERGIRNYNMSVSPLNYSNIQYDPFGNTSPHADGEIWSAVNFDLRQAFIEFHDAIDPDNQSTDLVKQEGCAEGNFAPQDCPGNRRWVQIMHDGFLLQPATPSMVDARDAQMAADLMRFTDDPSFGDHADLLWLVYARGGLGVGAASNDGNDLNPTASFELPAGHPTANAMPGFVALAQDEGSTPVVAEVFIGHYEARANPIATTAADGTPVTAPVAPGTYDMLVRADGYGHMRFTHTFTEGDTGVVALNLPTNWASAGKGATAAGEGTEHGSLIDDTEATNWDYTGQVGQGNGQAVIVTLPSEVTVNRVQVSALSHNGGNRYHQLRQFAVDACLGGLIIDCTQDQHFSEVYVSSPDGFNGQPIRPLAPNLIIQSFDLDSPVTATHLRLRALHNQCTGSTQFTNGSLAPGALPPDNDTDCRNSTNADAGGPLVERDMAIHAAEFQAFASVGFVDVDTDGDGVFDSNDNCPLVQNADQLDDDGDLVGSACDNCILTANGPNEGLAANQCDTNGDGFGNVCDGDLNNNLVINFVDLAQMKAQFFSADPDADLTCNGVVNFGDLAILKEQFFGAPGPSAFAP